MLEHRPQFFSTFFLPIAEAKIRHGKSRRRHIYEILRYCFWDGYFKRSDYYLYGFHRTPVVLPERARRFVGYTRSARLLGQVNRKDSVGRRILQDKLATEVVLRAADIPIEPVIAVHRPTLAGCVGQVLGNATEIAAFLREWPNYPVFGKPLNGVFSSGAVSLEQYDKADDDVVTTRGDRLKVNELAKEIEQGYPEGYIFQRRIRQHPDLIALSGPTVSSIRVLTVLKETGPEILYAIIKVADPKSVADNTWRPGLAACLVNPETGQVVKASTRRDGVREDVSEHPTLSVPLIGMEVPLWNDVRRVALAASKVFADHPIVGWDIAVGQTGALIIEGNEEPGPSLYQAATDQGFLSTEIETLLSDMTKDIATRKQRSRTATAHPDRLKRLRAGVRKFDIWNLLR
ncbi:sugar-transfer associated ATP-grasp domain-containing protein [Roseovarius sp.]|uniref:sugar-transfer associated ATP-grasp domain-containing protein n=1 Tax=Roseovarius sp. TaxID=1486281 RepID=UPI0035615874